MHIGGLFIHVHWLCKHANGDLFFATCFQLWHKKIFFKLSILQNYEQLHNISMIRVISNAPPSLEWTFLEMSSSLGGDGQGLHRFGCKCGPFGENFKWKWVDTSQTCTGVTMTMTHILYKVITIQYYEWNIHVYVLQILSNFVKIFHCQNPNNNWKYSQKQYR